MALLLARAGFAATRRGGSRPRGLLVAASLLAVPVGVLGAAAVGPGGAQTPAAYAAGLPLATVLAAAATAWSTRFLLLAAVASGVLVGALAAVVPDTGAAAAAVAAGTGFTVVAATVAVTCRLSVWVLDVVERTERHRGLQMQLAVAEERLRFARDLHDVMGRNLSLIAVKSQLAAELVRRGQEGGADEIADVGRIAEDSLREMRDVVRAYRTTDLAAELAGARSVLRAAGVACTVTGEDAGAALPAPAQVALGWVVREAVTNVLRHSRATEATVDVTSVGGLAVLEVGNDGAGPGGPAVTWGSGLTGLAERLTAASGGLRVERDGDRFVLAASVPVAAAGAVP
jgi:two-component system sensor histidine kinase DesK